MPPRRKTTQKVERPLEPLILKLKKLKDQIKGAQGEIHTDSGEGVEDILLKLMKERNLDSVAIAPDGSNKLTATAVYSSTEEIDPVALKKKLGAVKWKNVTTLALDTKKLQDAIARGEVDANIVAQCATTKPKKPYIKLTESKKGSFE